VPLLAGETLFHRLSGQSYPAIVSVALRLLLFSLLLLPEAGGLHCPRRIGCRRIHPRKKPVKSKPNYTVGELYFVPLAGFSYKFNLIARVKSCKDSRLASGRLADTDCTSCGPNRLSLGPGSNKKTQQTNNYFELSHVSPSFQQPLWKTSQY